MTIKILKRYFKYCKRIILKMYLKIIILLKIKFRRKSASSLYIFDLDNTLADTWPSLNLYFSSNSERLKSLKPITGMVKMFDSLILRKKNIYILTARSFEYFFLTKKWLKKNTEFKNSANLILVEKPKDKLKFLRLIKQKYEVVYYYDDLSYNHENKDTKFHHDIINEVKKDVNKYYGYDFILENFK